jgi:NAD(P)-dependent dehydrogenase (short-subunit alcohol dehydrogenase family)
MSPASKVVVITGASGGIGTGLVRSFLDRGWRVVGNSLSIDPASSADMLTVAGDIADPAVADRVINGAVEAFGRVDTLINNAGIFISRPFTEYTEAEFTRKVSVNVAGFFYVSQRAVRQMLTQGGGHIVNMTTTLVGQPVRACRRRWPPSPREDWTR